MPSWAFLEIKLSYYSSTLFLTLSKPKCFLSQIKHIELKNFWHCQCVQLRELSALVQTCISATLLRVFPLMSPKINVMKIAMSKRPLFNPLSSITFAMFTLSCVSPAVTQMNTTHSTALRALLIDLQMSANPVLPDCSSNRAWWGCRVDGSLVYL